jgi:Ca-activated chloride channel family protein
VEGFGLLPVAVAGDDHVVIFPDRWIGGDRMNKITVRFFFTLTILSHASSAVALEWVDLWLTPDQQGQRLLEQGEYLQAAGKFTTAERMGAALFLAGDFEKAASVFGRSANAEAHFNRGNAYIMLGQYDAAIEAYKSALSKRPDWSEAEQNLHIATLRKQALAPPDDDFGGTGGMLEADEYVFDQPGRVNNSSNEQVIDAADQQLGEDALRAMWLRKVETRPADFLAARFNYQLATRDKPHAEDKTEASDE